MVNYEMRVAMKKNRNSYFVFHNYFLSLQNDLKCKKLNHELFE